MVVVVVGTYQPVPVASYHPHSNSNNSNNAIQEHNGAPASLPQAHQPHNDDDARTVGIVTANNNDGSSGDSDDHIANHHHHHNNNTENDLSPWQATVHLIKGNLGPGCLNLPHAFARTGSRLGTGLFLLVAVQGIYSMLLLVECTNLLRQQRYNDNGDYDENGENDNVDDTTSAVPEPIFSTQQPQQPYGDNDVTPPPQSRVGDDARQHSPQQHPQQQRQHARPDTFMDVARTALGPRGDQLVSLSLLILQGGVCCVFLSLLATNVQAAWSASSSTNQHESSSSTSPLSSRAAVALVSVLLGCTVLLRFLKDLVWLCAMANVIMITAVLTASVAGVWNSVDTLRQDDGVVTEITDPLWGTSVQPFSMLLRRWLINSSSNNSSSDNDDSSTLVSTVITFTADMFFAFEGIGLVLPIENSYKYRGGRSPPVEPARTGTASGSNDTRMPQPTFSTVLLWSMTFTAMLFGLIGVTAAMGFPDIDSGSVTAYLALTYPNIRWFSIVNALVMVAVAFTFPLQLQPALQVLDQWCRSSPSTLLPLPMEENVSMLGRDDPVCAAASHSEPHQTQEGEQGNREQAPLELTESPCPSRMHSGTSDQQSRSHTVADLTSQIQPFVARRRYFLFRSSYGWILQRWAFVLVCALIVILVDDLGVLMALFGAVGQTGLAAMPCAIHLALQHQGVAPQHYGKTAIDLVILGFCGAVMIAGCSLVFKEIANGT